MVVGGQFKEISQDKGKPSRQGGESTFSPSDRLSFGGLCARSTETNHHENKAEEASQNIGRGDVNVGRRVKARHATRTAYSGGF